MQQSISANEFSLSLDALKKWLYLTNYCYSNGVIMLFKDIYTGTFLHSFFECHHVGKDMFYLILSSII